MMALARFQIAGFVRSQRALPPFLVVVLYVLLVLLQSPGAAHGRDLTVGTYGDSAALIFPVWAWVARSLLDTEPDVQRRLSALAVGHQVRYRLAGLLACYTVNLSMAALVLAVPLSQGVRFGVGAPAMLAGIGLTALSAAAATVAGAWTCRAILPSAAISVLALLGGSLAVLLLSMSPLSWMSVPMIGWLRAAHGGPASFVAVFPQAAFHTALWAALVGTVFVALPRARSGG